MPFRLEHRGHQLVRHPGHAGTHTWSKSSGGEVFLIRVIRPPEDPPAAPTNLALATSGDALDPLLDQTHTIFADVTGYDVHYTSVLNRGALTDTAPALNNPLGNKPVAGWVALPRSGTAASQTISSLLPGTAYRVRVRAKNSVGAGDWVFGTGTTSGTAPCARHGVRPRAREPNPS